MPRCQEFGVEREHDRVFAFLRRIVADFCGEKGLFCLGVGGSAFP